ncbi:MAG TPA: phenylalanine--tRNA ligase subunit alpha, partial [Planctomycetaceae bacterium]|nr:phenylalanine--tRNA ligase subunit alpha [Planctomycetaceae bacterium]
MDALQAFTEYEQDALTAIETASNADEIEAVRIEFLGKKKGRLKTLQTELGKVSNEDRPVVGKKFNEVKNRVESALNKKKQTL